eukprot:g376.t1
MNVRFAFIVTIVLFVVTPSLEFIGARAITQANTTQCATACAAANNNPSVLQEFIQQDINLCPCVCTGYNGGGPLHVAVRHGCGHCFHLLTTVPSTCPCDLADLDGNTPLHLAASLCNGPMTDRAINARCNVGGRRQNGDTPLCAVSRQTSGDQCGQVVRTLLREGAPPCLHCTGGTACEICGFPGTCNVRRVHKEIALSFTWIAGTG